MAAPHQILHLVDPLLLLQVVGGEDHAAAVAAAAPAAPSAAAHNTQELQQRQESLSGLDRGGEGYCSPVTDSSGQKILKTVYRASAFLCMFGRESRGGGRGEGR